MSSSQLPAKRQRLAELDTEQDGHVAAAAMRRVSQTAALPHPTTPQQSQPARRRNPQNGQVSSRTGQACDRCKTRKIRCDDTEGGCVPCRQSNSECRTTDRITQRATVRGHTENVERQNHRLQQHVADLEQQLRDLDVVPRSQYASYNHTYYPSSAAAPAPTSSSSTIHDPHRPVSQVTTPPPSDSSPNASIAQQDSLLSQPIGTSMSVFGMKIDLARFMDPGEESKESRVSFEAFHASLSHTSSEQSVWGPAHLPPTQQECINYAKTFIFGINPWSPSIHPPDFFALVDKVYDGAGYKLSLAETVMLHMVLANSKYHMGMRNEYGSAQSKVLLDEAFAHYHYSLTFFHALAQSRTLPDFQAMCLICVFTRCFSNATIAWYTTQLTLMHAVQIGLHRSLQAWPEEFARATPVTVQLRRCVFWTVYLIHVAVAAKLGHPLYLGAQDFDIEAPEAAETSTGLDNSLSSGASFGAIGYLYRLCELHADVYTTLYAVCPKGDYTNQLRSFEARLDKWRASLPTTMVYGSAESAQLHNKPFACWALYCSADLDLALHHPAACRTRAPDVLASNLAACTVAASNIITATVGLRSTKSIDTTWISVMSVISALFASLFTHWERRESLDRYDFNKLSTETQAALNILSESGEFLRTGPSLRSAVQDIMDRGLTTLSTFMATRTASAAAGQIKPESASNNVFEQASQQQQYAQATLDRQQPHEMHPSGQPALQRDYANEQIPVSSSLPPAYQSHVYNGQFANAFALPTSLATTVQMPPHVPSEPALMYDGAGSVTHHNAAAAYAGGSTGNWQSFADMNGGYLAAAQSGVGSVDSTTANALLAMNSMPSDPSGAQSQQHMLGAGAAGLGTAGSMANMAIEPTPWPASVGFQGQAQGHIQVDQHRSQQ